MNKFEQGLSVPEFELFPTEVFYSKAINVANHFGFVSIEDLLDGTKREVRVPMPKAADAKIDSLGGEFAKTAKTCVEHNLINNARANFFYHTTLSEKAPKATQAATFGLEIVGSQQSIAEAVILKTAYAIVKDLGIEDARVHINTIGDKDSSARYTRELTNFFRKHINTLPPSGQQALKRSPFDALEFSKQKQLELYDLAPRSMEFLSRDSRRHFKEVLEYLESTDIPYTIDEGVLGNRDCYTQTLFEIKKDLADDAKEGDAETTIARGGRYDALTQKLFKKAAPAVGIVFSLMQKGRRRLAKPRVAKKKKVFLIHVGPEAQRKSLTVVDELRKSRVPIAHTLCSSQLSEQLQEAKDLGAEYSVIIGQKESLENTAIVRNMDTRAQDTVPLEKLGVHIKKTVAKR